MTDPGERDVGPTPFAVSSDETRYNLNGVLFEPSPGALRTVAETWS